MTFDREAKISYNAQLVVDAIQSIRLLDKESFDIFNLRRIPMIKQLTESEFIRAICDLEDLGWLRIGDHTTIQNLLDWGTILVGND